ncbi:hypothetical protein NX722_05190 [Endozoicomonas gorgoniicola]|uniref:Uncharacterized protein n=1 Tax=Endozoicomonas gorgoniicola TaxID=1234144 RepID=A0ABT3MRQ6_9GAMM|nr:hypothetical protein [Endozoicomonas gorgoniicola]MCW7552046.1 hypothetical protein [Endozoicomonas gorgoniicola]
MESFKKESQVAFAAIAKDRDVIDNDVIKIYLTGFISHFPSGLNDSESPGAGYQASLM